MKKILLSFATFALALGLAGCKPGPEPGGENGGGTLPPQDGLSVSVTAGESTVSSISFSVDADNAEEVKYLVTLADGTLLADDNSTLDDKIPSEAAEAMSPVEQPEVSPEHVWENGTALSDLPAKVTVGDLKPHVEYSVWAVASAKEEGSELKLSEKVVMQTSQGSLELSGLGNYDYFDVSPSGATANWIVQDASQLKSWCLAFHNVAALSELDGKYYFCTSQAEADKLAGKENAPWIDVDGSVLICDGVTAHFAPNSAENYLEANKSTESNSTSYRLNALSYSGKYVLTALYLKGGEAEVEDVKAYRAMDPYYMVEIVKNGNTYTLKLTAHSGTFTCELETEDGVLSKDGFTEYVMTEDGTGSWKSGVIVEDVYRLNITSGSLFVRKIDETTYRFIIDAKGSGSGVDVTVGCDSKNGWDATVVSFTDEEKPAEKVVLELTSVDVSVPAYDAASGDYTMTFTATDSSSNKVVLFCHSTKDYLLYSSYIGPNTTEVAKMNNNLPHLYWVESGKSYIEYQGTKYNLLNNNPNSYFRVVSHQMPYADNNSAMFLAWDEAAEKEFSFNYSGAFNYKNVIEKVALTLSSLSYNKASDTGRVLSGEDSNGNKVCLHCELDGKYAENDFVRKARYPFRSEADANASNKNWTDTTKSYVEYQGTKYYFSTESTAHYLQVAACEMPTTNFTSIKLTAVSTEGHKEFTVDYSGEVNGYTGSPVEMKSVQISGWVSSGLYADSNNASFYSFMAQANVATSTYQIKFNVPYSASALKTGKHYVASSQAEANEFAGSTEDVLWMDAASSTFYYNSAFYSLKPDKDSYFTVKEDGSFEYSVKTSNGLYNFHGTGSDEIPEASEEVGQTSK